MGVRLKFAAALVACAALAPWAAAQTTISYGADGPDYLRPNAPFTLSRVTRTQTRLQNGSSLELTVNEKLTRDAMGRVFDLSNPVLKDPLARPQQFYTLADPVATSLTQWRTGSDEAVGVQLPPHAHLLVHALWTEAIEHTKLPSAAKSTTEALGTQEIAGFTATGTRTTTEIPAGAVNNTDPLRIVHEVWISDTLGIPLRELDINPFTGTRTMNTEKATENASGDALFHLPAGLHVKIMPTRPPGTSAADGPDTAAYHKAQEDLKAPETREAAAEVLLHYAADHEEAANHVAHLLAVRNTHLPEAKVLAEHSVQALEQASSTLAVGDHSASAAEEMFNLAEYWDTLGSVYVALGENDTATRYFRLAWNLGGEGLYLDHVAQLEVTAGDKAAALHDIAVALSGKMDARETDFATRRAQRLGEPHPQALPEPLVLDVSGVAKREGTAEFSLLFTGSGAPAVQFAGGDHSLGELEKTIGALHFPVQVPDSGPEHILRQAELRCAAATGCKLRLLYAWQAEEEANTAVGAVTTAPPPPPPSPPSLPQR